MSPFDPLCDFDTITREALNRSLVAWGHKMGPWQRPPYPEYLYGLRVRGDLVAVTAAAGLIGETCAVFTRAEAVDLGRVCACRPDLCRVILRLWREIVFPDLCRAHGWGWAVSYQDAALHSGDLYRFDGWVRVGESRSGTDQRSGRAGRRKVIWGWTGDRAARAARRGAS